MHINLTPVPSAKAIFIGALELPNAGERSDYLDRVCGEDAALRQKVEELLALTDAQASNPLDRFVAKYDPPQTASMVSAADDSENLTANRQVGPYKLRELLGDGGMGRVFVAEQDKPVRRKVALKIIKPGMGSQEVISRFEVERQTLALMDHPNIAKVFDAGTTESGSPYFVMELVKGIPITEHCDMHKLKTRERLDLFLQVCQAVQHAHQKGIIHRDLKPSNIIVAMHDTIPVVKVIDFGVAKAIGQQLAEHSLYTGVSQMLGTPLYMSPEQAGQSSLDIDTRSDVYSLGVLLYELLTGSTPFESAALQQAGFDEMRRMIREVDPPRPSARISTLNAAALSTIAVRRQVEPRKFSQLLCGELDWIVMRALEKDRNRRYETANGLARDVQRYLAEEPVEARPASASYRYRKFAQRNRATFTTGAIVTVALILGIAGTSWQAIRAKAGMTRALVAEQIARKVSHDSEVLSNERERARQETASKLFDAFIRESRALRLARQAGYRSKVWSNLKQAAELGFPNKDLAELRVVAVESLGDPIGLDPIPSPTVERFTPSPLPEAFVPIIQSHGLIQPNGRGMKSHAVDREGKWVAIYTGENVGLWNAAGERLATGQLPYKATAYYGMACTADGRLLVAGTDEGTVIWSLPDLSLHNVLRGDAEISVAISPDNSTLATMNRSKRIEVISVDSIRPFATLYAPEGTRTIEFSKDGTMLLALSETDVALIGWHITQCPEKKQLPGLRASRVSFSPDGSKVAASAGPGTTIDLWDTATTARIATYQDHPFGTMPVAFIPDGKLLASGDNMGNVFLWNCAAGRRVAETRVGAGLNRPYLWQLDFAFAGQVLFGAGDSGVFAWKVEKHADGFRLERFLHLPMPSVRNLAIHPNGTDIVFGTFDGKVFLYDLRKAAGPDRLEISSMDMLKTTNEQIFAMNTLHFDAAGRRLVFATPDRKAGVWDWQARQLIRTTTAAFLPPRFSLNGRWLAGLRPANRAVIADLETGEEVVVLPEEKSSVFALDWSRDGRYLALGLAEGGVAIWDLEQVRRHLATIGFDLPLMSAAAATTPAFAPITPGELQRIVEKNQSVDGYEKVVFVLWKDLLDSEILAGSNADQHLKAEFLADGFVHYVLLDRVLKLLHETSARKQYRDDPTMRKLDTMVLIASACYKSGKPDIALLLNREILDLMRKSLPATASADQLSLLNIRLRQIARCCLKLGDLDGALAACRDTLRAKPDDAYTHRQVAWLLATQVTGFQQPPEAVEYALKAVELAPKDFYCWNTLGVASYENGAWKEAIAALEKSEAMASAGLPENWLFLAMSHWQLGQRDEARSWYDKAAEWMKNNPFADGLTRFRAEADELLGIVNEPEEAEQDYLRSQAPAWER